MRRERERQAAKDAEKQRAKEQIENARAMGLEPQPGPQTDFWTTSADIAIYGGAAGSGKSWALLAEPTKHRDVPGFGCVVFRRTMAQVTQQGGLWDAAGEMYLPLGGRDNKTLHRWAFPGGGEIQFAHLQYESDKHNYQGAQIALLGFDELTHFTESQFFYLLARNRSMCGVEPRTRATTNPDADSWVAKLLAWWIDPETGYPIPDRSGVLRWLVRDDDTIVWADTRDELKRRFPALIPMSLTFIAAKLDDNALLEAKDPGYRAKLMLLDRVERERLLGGNWKIRPSAGMYFKRSYFTFVDVPPAKAARVRAWDLGATEAGPGKDPDWTVGVLVSRDPDGFFTIEHAERLQGSPGKVEATIKNTASGDGPGVTIRIPQDPGQAGKSQVGHLIRQLPGFVVKSKPVTGDKQTRARPVSSQAEAGNIRIVRGAWNDEFLAVLEAFPDGSHDDDVDALSDAIDELIAKSAPMPAMNLDFGAQQSTWNF